MAEDLLEGFSGETPGGQCGTLEVVEMVERDTCKHYG
jgi:hypothetical protein